MVDLSGRPPIRHWASGCLTLALAVGVLVLVALVVSQ